MKRSAATLQHALEAYFTKRDVDAAQRMVIPAIRNAADHLQAYFHPLGFVHVPIGNVNDHKLRLHIWPEGDMCVKSPQWTIHNHAFRFESLILAGLVQSIPCGVHQIIASPGDEVQRLFRLVQREEITTLIGTKAAVRITSGAAEQFSIGAKYDIGAGAFHSSQKVGVGLAATLVLACKMDGVTSYVVGTGSAEAELSWVRRWVTTTELRSLLDQLLAVRSGSANKFSRFGGRVHERHHERQGYRGMEQA